MEWQYKKLGDVCIVERGSSPRPIKDFQTNSPDGVNWIKIGDTKGVGKYITRTKEKITPEGASKSRQVNEGDFILSNSMSFGKPYIMAISGYIHDGWFVLRLPDNIDTDFFYFLLSSPYVQDQFQSLASGAIVKNISGDLVKKATLPIPLLDEQKRIVAILDQASADIEQAHAKAEQNLKNTRELFESKKHQLFDHLGKTSKLVPLPLTCDEIFAGGDAPKKGVFSKEKTKIFNIPIFANAVKNNGLYGFTDYSRANKPSITIAGRGSGTGHIELRKEPFLPIVRLIVLTPNQDVLSLEYLKHALQALDILKSGSAIPQLTVPMIKEYSIPVPSLEVQNTIVEELEVLNVYIEKVQKKYLQKTNLLDELKKSILQKAFSGELTKDIKGVAA